MEIFSLLGCLASIFFAFYVPRIRSYSQKEVEITTDCGKFIGRTTIFQHQLEHWKPVWINQFLGIPFAEPPIGNLRFQEPQCLKCWSGQVFKALEMPNACVQFAERPFPWTLDEKDKKNVSEDCLYLNIWTPVDASEKSKKAVLFWIHGGFFLTGSIRQEIYDGRVVAGIGDIVVVTTNYRLGSLGFWTSDKTTAPGNVGMWDIVEAFRWVNRYIIKFGGDKDRVTIAGQGAGAIAVGLLSVARINPGWYIRQIMESGSPMFPLAEHPEDTSVLSRTIATRVGCVNESYRLEDHSEEVETCMRSIDALELMKQDSRIRPGPYSSFIPRWGDRLIPRHPREEILKGKFHHGDLLIGHNTEDSAFELTTSEPEIFGFYGQKWPEIDNITAKRLVRKLAPTFPNVDRSYQIYKDKYKYGKAKFFAVQALGDYMVACPSLYYAEKMADQNRKVHYYQIHSLPMAAHDKWARWVTPTHFQEVQYLFGDPFRDYVHERIQLSAEMITLWTDFVKHGSSKLIPEGSFYIINTLVRQRDGSFPYEYEWFLDHEQCEFMRPYFGMKPNFASDRNKRKIDT